MSSQESTHGEQFRQDLIQNIERNVGLDTIMRLRTSTGKIFVREYSTNACRTESFFHHFTLTAIFENPILF